MKIMKKLPTGLQNTYASKTLAHDPAPSPIALYLFITLVQDLFEFRVSSPMKVLKNAATLATWTNHQV